MCFQTWRKSSRCHREPCVWLNDQESLLPGSNPSSQQDEKRAIRFGASRSFDLPVKNDKLLAQKSVFGYELGSTSAKISQCSERQ